MEIVKGEELSAPGDRASEKEFIEAVEYKITGGSDYHGLSVKPSRTLGMTPVPYESVVALEAAIATVRAQGE